MIFLGDVASPTKEHSTNFKNILTQYDHLFSNQTIVFNLEGMIADEVSLQTNSPILFNHSSVLDAFPSNSNLVAALANNHTLDLPDFYEATIQQLKSKGIPYFGAGKNSTEAKKVVEIYEDGKKFFLINACWDFLLYHQENPSRGVYINTIQEIEILNQVQQIKKDNPEAAIAVYFHWSFDLETLPFPMYREFAKDLIDQGVNLVVGAHSHCVQGGKSSRTDILFMVWVIFIYLLTHLQMARSGFLKCQKNKWFCNGIGKQIGPPVIGLIIILKIKNIL